MSGIWSQTGGQVSGSACAGYYNNQSTARPPATSIMARITRIGALSPQGTIVDMQLTHFGHSCLLAEFDHTRVLFDPGPFAHGFEGITGLTAILLLTSTPTTSTSRGCRRCSRGTGSPRCTPTQTTAQLGAPWREVHVGDELQIGELTVRAVGGKHAVIHPEIPVIENIPYLVGDETIVPG